MTRVLHVITTLGLGGAERMLASLVLASPGGNVQHAVVSLVTGGAYGDRLRDAGVHVTELGMGPWPTNPWPVTARQA